MFKSIYASSDKTEKEAEKSHLMNAKHTQIFNY